MQGKYDVIWNGQSVGTVEIKREGLYYRIFCRCNPVDGEIHRLYVDWDKLGVLIPERGALVLETRVAAKRLKAGGVFTLDGMNETFLPICAGEPFVHLDKLRKAKLAFQNGQTGLRIVR